MPAAAGASRTAAVHLIDLGSGADRQPAVPAVPADLVWSPDSRWLFVAGSDGMLYAVNAATGHVERLDVQLSGISQLAIRQAPR